MGTWGTAIKSNDTSAETYADFFELYNDGSEPIEITSKLITDNPNGDNDFLFALALALWETKSLTADILEKVREIIESESDLKLWKELGADTSDINKRRVVLDKFLIKLESEKSKPKPRKKTRTKAPIFEKGTCLTFKLENGNYGGAVVLDADISTKFGYNLIVPTRINQSSKPTINDFKNCRVLVVNFGNWKNETQINWVLPDFFKRDFIELFEVIGSISIKKKYDPVSNSIRAGFTSDWSFIIDPMNKQLEHEKEHGETTSFSIKKLIKRKRWWQ